MDPYNIHFITKTGPYWEGKASRTHTGIHSKRECLELEYNIIETINPLNFALDKERTGIANW